MNAEFTSIRHSQPQKTPARAESKAKLCVSTSEPIADTLINRYLDRDTLKSQPPTIRDFKALLEKAEIRNLSDKQKSDYIVIKTSFCLYENEDRRKIAMFQRRPGQHSNKIAEKSVVFSVGPEHNDDFSNEDGVLRFNMYAGVSRKFGVHAGQIVIPYFQSRDLPTAVSFKRLAFKQDGRRYYLFLLHDFVLTRRNEFPEIFKLKGRYKSPDGGMWSSYFNGFVPAPKALKEIRKEGRGLSIDEFALGPAAGVKDGKIPDDIWPVELNVI